MNVRNWPSALVCAAMVLTSVFANAASGPADPGLAQLRLLVRESVNRSPAIREAQANWRAAEQDALQSRAGAWPKLDISANSGSARLESGGSTGPANLALSATYSVFDFGRLRHQVDAREQQAGALENQLRTVVDGTVYDTALAYLQWIKQTRLNKVYDQHIVELTGLIDKLAATVQVLPGRRSELTQAQTRMAQAQDALAAVKAKQREHQLSLTRLTGLTLTPALSSADLPTLPEDSEGLLESVATQDHPTLRAARAEAAAAKARLAEIQAGQKPQIDLQASKQTGTDVYGASSPAQLFVTARWTAFDGGGGRTQIQALLERARSAEERAEQLALDIRFNVLAAKADYEVQTRRIELLRQLVPGTDQVRKDYFDQWRELGRRTLLDVLTAENEHLNTRLSLVASEVDQTLALLRMRHEAAGLRVLLLDDNGQAASGTSP